MKIKIRGTLVEIFPQPHSNIIDFLVRTDDDHFTVKCSCYGNKMKELESVKREEKIEIAGTLIAEQSSSSGKYFNNIRVYKIVKISSLNIEKCYLKID